MAAGRRIAQFVPPTFRCLLVAGLFAGCLARPAFADWYGPPITTTAPYGLFEVYPGNFNHDGITDAVAHAYNPDRLVIYMGTPGGTMTAVQEAELWHEDHLSHRRVAILDWDGDGYDDILENCNPG